MAEGECSETNVLKLNNQSKRISWFYFPHVVLTQFCHFPVSRSYYFQFSESISAGLFVGDIFSAVTQQPNENKSAYCDTWNHIAEDRHPPISIRLRHPKQQTLCVILYGEKNPFAFATRRKKYRNINNLHDWKWRCAISFLRRNEDSLLQGFVTMFLSI